MARKSTSPAISQSALVMILAFVTALAPYSVEAETVKILHNFKASPDGASPWGSLVGDGRGAFYGTTWEGGTFGFGTVFKLGRTGKRTVLHSFAGGSDGSSPQGGLVRDAAGNLFGTTVTGGGARCFRNYGCGTIFEVSPNGKGGWTEKVIYSFKGGVGDGAHPGYGKLLLDSAGKLYGTTTYGGKGSCSTGCGVVFQLAVDGDGWKETVLHAFDGSDGGNPYSGLIQDKTGNLYGTTFAGGNNSCTCGTVFKLDPGGLLTSLYNFSGGQDGSQPYAGLIRDSAGNFYGTTWSGGVSGYGTVYKLDTQLRETVLHSFSGYPTDGAAPFARLAHDRAGNLYGTTYFGGNGGGFCQEDGQKVGCGTIFKIDRNGVETVLHDFHYRVDGAEIISGVMLDKKGNLYGTTSVGGPEENFGTVYKVSPE